MNEACRLRVIEGGKDRHEKGPVRLCVQHVCGDITIIGPTISTVQCLKEEQVLEMCGAR